MKDARTQLFETLKLVKPQAVMGASESDLKALKALVDAAHDQAVTEELVEAYKDA